MDEELRDNNSEQEFRQLYKTVYRENVEKQAETIKKIKIGKRVAAGIVFLLSIAAGITYIIKQKVDQDYWFYIFLFLATGTVLYISIIKPVTQAVIGVLNDKGNGKRLYEALLKNIDEGLENQEFSTINKGTFIRSGLFNEFPLLFSSETAIKGSIDGVRFKHGRIIAERREDKHRYSKIFEGLFLMVDLGISTNFRTVVKPNEGFDEKIKGVNRFFLGFDKLNEENPQDQFYADFFRKYDVIAEDEQEALKILTRETIEKLCEISRSLGKTTNTRFCFVDNILIIAYEDAFLSRNVLGEAASSNWSIEYLENINNWFKGAIANIKNVIKIFKGRTETLQIDIESNSFENVSKHTSLLMASIKILLMHIGVFAMIGSLFFLLSYPVFWFISLVVEYLGGDVKNQFILELIYAFVACIISFVTSAYVSIRLLKRKKVELLKQQVWRISAILTSVICCLICALGYYSKIGINRSYILILFIFIYSYYNSRLKLLCKIDL